MTKNQNITKKFQFRPPSKMPNPRPPTKPLLVPPTSKSISSPSRSHSCSSTPTRRTACADKEELIKPRWSCYIKKPTTNASRQGASQTRIPRLPSRGKENSRGRGARVVKPVGRPKLSTDMDVSPPSILTPSSKDNSLSTVSISEPRSPNLISSKAVPDLHQKILAKIRLNKRRSQTRNNTPNQSPCKAPAPPARVSNASSISNMKQEAVFSDRDSPVSGQELETYLTSMFYTVDTYR